MTFLEGAESVSDDLIARIKSEFLEMPGLRLTESQAQRLWAVDADACGEILRVLVGAGFLFKTRDGAFMRVEYSRPAKAQLPPAGRVAVA
jgi:hypothetical protein